MITDSAFAFFYFNIPFDFNLEVIADALETVNFTHTIGSRVARGALFGVFPEVPADAVPVEQVSTV